MKRRVVITSIGVVCSLGRSSGEIIESLKKDRTSFERHASDPEVAVAPVRDFDIRSHTGSFKDKRYLNRGALFAVAAALDAARFAKAGDEFFVDAGLFAGAGPNFDIGGEFPEISAGALDRRDLQALWMLKFLPNTAASAISKIIGIRGENLTVSTACASSLQAIGEAYRRIRDGYLDRALAGGGDSRLSPGGVLAYRKAGVLSTMYDPEKASRPFDSGRQGFVPGEGGAFFLLEELEAAQRRGACIQAELCGYGSSMDAHNMTMPDPQGAAAKQAAASALREAQLALTELDVVSAHGTGTVLNDQMEAGLIASLYGNAQPLVIALKSWIGHGAAACGALEFAITLACLKEGYLPQIRNLDDPLSGEIHFVAKGMEKEFRTVLLENFGFGGQNAALVIKKFEQ